LKSFLKAASGFGDLPIHYPRTADQTSGGGEHYKWFEANERGQKLALPDLSSDDVSLPLDPQ